MLTIKETKTGTDIEYSKGDTFEFTVSSTDILPDGTSIRFQISQNGDTDDILLEKTYALKDNRFYITLDNTDIAKLDINNLYQYRLTLFSIDNSIMTNVSGNLLVKWGA